jgi:hypothetical protein
MAIVSYNWPFSLNICDVVCKIQKQYVYLGLYNHFCSQKKFKIFKIELWKIQFQ